jgi:hypothetical protein
LKIKRFEITEKQEKAFKELVKAFKRCKRAGLSLYGKQDAVVAYRSSVFKNNLDCEPLNGLEADKGNPIPYISSRGCINDSGADDTLYFKKGVIDD